MFEKNKGNKVSGLGSEKNPELAESLRRQYRNYRNKTKGDSRESILKFNLRNSSG